MIERSRVRIPAGTTGEFSSPGSTFCADSYFGIRSTPVFRAQELCESRGGRPGLPSLISLMVSVDVKQHSTTPPCYHSST